MLLIAALALVAPVCAEPAWQNVIVDRSGSTYNPSMAMNESGYTGIGYSTTISLKYAESSGNGWEIATVDTPGSVINKISLALDSSGNPRIAYEPQTGPVMYAERSGTAWTTTTVAASSGSAAPSLALNSSGNPGIAYRDGAGNLAYAEWNGAGWTISTFGAGQQPSLAFDASGNPRIAYRNSNRDVHILERNGIAWTDTLVEAGPVPGTCKGTIGLFFGPDLALDPAGSPSIVYARCVAWNTMALMYANRSGSSWTATAVNDDAGYYATPSLAFKPDGFPGISYANRTDYLSYTSSDGGSWTRSIVDPIATSAGEIPLAIVPGTAGIAYTDDIDGAYAMLFAKKSSGLPDAGFTATPTGGDAPLTVAFTDTSTHEPGGWQWNFGSYSAADGGVSDLRNPTHVYSSPGTYTVSSMVRNANGGSSATRVGYITVTDAGSGAATAIVVDPVSASTVYAGLDGSGVYRSTTGGSSWAGATTQPSNTRIRAIAINPVTRSILYAGTYGGGVNRSTDSGVNWGPCGNTGLANLNVLSLVSDSSGKLYAGTEDGIYTSTDCDTWDPVNNGLP